MFEKKRYGRAKTDLTGLTCMSCGKPATELMRFNVKRSRCGNCIQKEYAAMAKEKMKEISLSGGEGSTVSGFMPYSGPAKSNDREAWGALNPGMTNRAMPGANAPIKFRFCPGCGADLSTPGTVLSVLNGHIENEAFVADNKAAAGAENTYQCTGCSAEVR